MVKDTLFGMGEILLNFNRDNVNIFVTKSSAYCGGYELHVSASCLNEKLKAIAKLERKAQKRTKASISDYDPAFSQLRFFLLGLGVEVSRMDYPSRSMSKRASKGVKSISLKYHFNDAKLAYALGLDLTSSYGSGKLPNTKEEILNREEHLERVIQNLQTLQFENRQKSEQESKITGQDANEIWKEKYQQFWKESLDKARSQGIAYHVFSNINRKVA